MIFFVVILSFSSLQFFFVRCDYGRFFKLLFCFSSSSSCIFLCIGVVLFSLWGRIFLLGVFFYWPRALLFSLYLFPSNIWLECYNNFLFIEKIHERITFACNYLIPLLSVFIGCLYKVVLNRQFTTFKLLNIMKINLFFNNRIVMTDCQGKKFFAPSMHI